MLTPILCIKTIMCKDENNNDCDPCEFREGILYEAEIHPHVLIVDDNSGELHHYNNDEWKEIFKII